MRGRVAGLIAAILAVAATSLTGCSATSEVGGRVSSASTGEPVAGATVKLAGLTTTTGPDGTFTVSEVKRGETTGVVKVPGFPDTSFRVAVEGDEVTAAVQVPDCTLDLVVEENAVEQKPVDEYTVELDGTEASSTVTLGPVPPGPRRIAVRAPGREDFETTITLKPGANKVPVALCLTPLETYKRFFAAGRYHRDSVAYKYIHPDERKKKLSLKKWKKWGSGTEDKSIKFGDVRMLGKWKSKYTKKTYSNVAEVDRTIVYQVSDAKYSDFGKTYTDNFSQHWVKVDGRWYLVHAKGP